MDLFNDWKNKLQPILQLYKDRKHPLEYTNLYELVIMVILSAQDSDSNINKISQPFFKTYPDLSSIAISDLNTLSSLLTKVSNFNTKTNWIFNLAVLLKENNNIPLTLNRLTELKGIGRKSANVILRESKRPAEGIIVDLHVIRVAPRLGLTSILKDGNQIEKKLMQVLPYEIWNDVGMALSYLGREICRPTDPHCIVCPLNSICLYYLSVSQQVKKH